MEGFLRIFYLVKKPCVEIQKLHESISWLYRAETAVAEVRYTVRNEVQWGRSSKQSPDDSPYCRDECVRH